MTSQNLSEAQVPQPKGRKVYPFYFVVDESGSMTGAPIDAVNRSVQMLYKKMTANPVQSGQLHVSFIGFNEVATEIMPLADFSSVSGAPQFEAQGGTRFGEVFDLLSQAIPRDLNALESMGFRFSRPIVFFITDGNPQDDGVWQSAYKKLTDVNFRFHPKVVSFGVGEVLETTLREVATSTAYVPNNNEHVEPASVLSEIFTKMSNTMTATLDPNRTSDAVPLPPVQGMDQKPALDVGDI